METPCWVQQGYLQRAPCLEPLCHSAPPEKPNLGLTARRAEVGTLRSWDSLYRALLALHEGTVGKNAFLPCLASFCLVQVVTW